MFTIPFLARYLGGIDAPEHPVLQVLLDAAVADVEGKTGRTFREPDTLTEYYDGTGERALELRCAVSSGTPAMYIDYGGGSWTAVDSSYYRVERNPALGIDNLVVLTCTRWPYGTRNIKVVYEGGYSLDAGEPADIRALIGDMVGLRYRGRMVAQPTQGATDDGIPERHAAVLARWRLVTPTEQVRLVKA